MLDLDAEFVTLRARCAPRNWYPGADYSRIAVGKPFDFPWPFIVLVPPDDYARHWALEGPR